MKIIITESKVGQIKTLVQEILDDELNNLRQEADEEWGLGEMDEINEVGSVEKIVVDEIKMTDGISVNVNLYLNTDREDFDIILPMIEYTIEQWMAIDDVGPKMAQSLFDFFHRDENLKLLVKLESLGVNLKGADINKTGILYGKQIVFTGFRNPELEKKIEALGGEVGNTLSKKTSILIMKEKGSGSSKEKKALDYGVEVMTVEEFEMEYSSI